jgi:hypothetical protein
VDVIILLLDDTTKYPDHGCNFFSRCLLCNFDMEGEELEECGYLHLDDSSHLLHAVVHANGYGHLLRVNGREGGSRLLTGRDIMSFWDRLCNVLHVR